MDICSWDWGVIGSIAGAIGSFAGAAATLYAARMAWRIYQGWTVEKRAEVFSNKADHFIGLIELYRNKLIELHSEIMYFKKSNLKYAELKDIERSIRNFDRFFDKLMGHTPDNRSAFFLELNYYSNIIRDELESGATILSNDCFHNLIEHFDENEIITNKKDDLIYLLKYENAAPHECRARIG